MIRAALSALTHAGVPFALRGDQPIDGPPPGEDVDILVGAADLGRAHRILRNAGLRRLRAPGCPGHRFYLGFDEGRWLKLDLNIVPRRLGWDLSATDAEHLERFGHYRGGALADGDDRLPARVFRAWDNRRPLSLRRRGPVIALLGPDGAGKGSVGEALEREVPVALARLYLGEGGDSSTAAHVNGDARQTEAAQPVERAPGALREAQHLARRGVRAWWRVVWPGYARAWRGDIIVFDRHPIEVLAVRPRRTRLGGAVERTLARHLIPWPDVVVVLDAPGEVLFERKGEHSPDVLERWRRGYLEVFAGDRAAVVSTLGGLEEAVATTSAVVWDALRRRRGW